MTKTIDGCDFSPETEYNVRVSFEFHGQCYPATRHSPAEYPEVEITEIILIDIDGFEAEAPDDHEAWKIVNDYIDDNYHKFLNEAEEDVQLADYERRAGI